MNNNLPLILLVEDDNTVAEMVVGFVLDGLANILVAPDIDTAKKLMVENRFVAVILDGKVPPFSSEIANTPHLINLFEKEVVVIAFSSDPASNDVLIKKAIEMGHPSHLCQKPFEAPYLRGLIKNL